MAPTISFRLDSRLNDILTLVSNVGQIICIPTEIKFKEKLTNYPEEVNNLHKLLSNGNSVYINGNSVLIYNNINNVRIEHKIEKINEYISINNVPSAHFNISSLKVKNNKIYIYKPDNRSIAVYDQEINPLYEFNIGTRPDLKIVDGYVRNTDNEYPVSFTLTNNELIVVLHLNTSYLSIYSTTGKYIGKAECYDEENKKILNNSRHIHFKDNNIIIQNFEGQCYVFELC